MNDDDRVGRLERRVERERRARVEAEEIAERGTRELWLANRDLESRVRDRTVDLERSLLAARQAGAAKEAFLADLGHDLATPLHAVLGHLELIDRAALDPDDRGRLDTAMTNAEALAAMLRALVDLAGAEGVTGPDEIEPREPARWMDDLVAEWSRRAAARGQLLIPTCRTPADHVAASWNRLRQIADLVIDNAVVHADAGPLRVEVDVVFASRTGGHDDAGSVSFRVVDSGPGLDDDQLLRALEPFVSFGERGGLGIGLARADRLAGAAGGAVALANTANSTEVVVTMPARPVDDEV